MAIDAKVSFLGQIEKKCSDKLTVTDMGKVLEIISDILENFDMRESANWGSEEQDDMLDSFMASMKVQGRSKLTIQRYVYIINKFMAFVKVPTRRVNVYHVRNWITSEKERGVQDSTTEGCRQVLSSYFGWLHREGLIDKNPTVNVGAIKVAKKQRSILEDDDIEKLIRECKKPRDRAIIHFLRSTGCRVSEMVGLNRDAINLMSRECVVHGKGNKERFVYLDKVTTMALHEYLLTRTDKNDALFVNRYGERLLPGGVRTMLNGIAKKANVNHVHPHKFRRTLATEMTRRGMPIQEAASILGHEKLDTTNRYIVLNNDDIKSSYRRYA